MIRLANDPTIYVRAPSAQHDSLHLLALLYNASRQMNTRYTLNTRDPR